MTSGKLRKKPADVLRDNLNKRSRKAIIQTGEKIGKLTHAQLVTPSQRKSELLRKKLNRGVTPVKIVTYDCWDCQKTPCYQNLQTCQEPSVEERCGKCGQMVRHRIIAGETWERCTDCRKVEA